MGIYSNHLDSYNCINKYLENIWKHRPPPHSTAKQNTIHMYIYVHYVFTFVIVMCNTRCDRFRCPLARLSGLQCYNMGHNGHGINR